MSMFGMVRTLYGVLIDSLNMTFLRRCRDASGGNHATQTHFFKETLG